MGQRLVPLFRRGQLRMRYAAAAGKADTEQVVNQIDRRSQADNRQPCLSHLITDHKGIRDVCQGPCNGRNQGRRKHPEKHHPGHDPP